jgi:hypothetical protein
MSASATAHASHRRLRGPGACPHAALTGHGGRVVPCHSHLPRAAHARISRCASRGRGSFGARGFSGSARVLGRGGSSRFSVAPKMPAGAASLRGYEPWGEFPRTACAVVVCRRQREARHAVRQRANSAPRIRGCHRRWGWVRLALTGLGTAARAGTGNRERPRWWASFRVAHHAGVGSGEGHRILSLQMLRP